MEGVMTDMPITSAEDKAQRRLEVKARSTLMIGIPNEHHKLSYIAAFEASKEAVWVRNHFWARHFRCQSHYLLEVIEFGDLKSKKSSLRVTT
ncbi:hypothetical protein Tco_1211675 [Tanacetum coccineum]